MIEVRGLTKRYGSTLAVDDLSFDVLPDAPSKPANSITSSTTASGRRSLAVLTALLPVCATLVLPAPRSGPPC